MFKDELGGKIMTDFCALRAKTYSYKLDDDTEMKKAKGTKKCLVKREITLKNYADALFNDEIIIRSQQRFRSDHHKVCTEEVNKIALSSNDDKRIQAFDKVTMFPYGTNIFQVCESEMLSKNKLIELDDDIDNTKTKDINNTKTEDIDISKTEDINISKTEDIDISETEDIDISKTEDIDISKTEDIGVRYSKQWHGKKMVIGKEDKLYGSFGITVMYQNYVKSGYILMVNMDTQGLKSFAHILERCFLLGNIRELHKKTS